MRHKLSRLWERTKVTVAGSNKKRTASFLIAMLLPAVIFTWVGLIRPISFDGAMNLQVAQSLAEHGRYERHYVYANSRPAEKAKGVREFPSEVETNGPYIIVAATGIRIFGETQLGFQFASVVFAVGIAVLVWWVLKRWLLVAAFAPTLVLLSLPGTFDTTLGGYGEMPAIFLVLLAFVLVMQAAAKKTKSEILKYISLAFLVQGAAYTTKTYLIGALPALLLGVLIVAYGKRGTIRLKEVTIRFLYIAVLPVLYEFFRFISFGSLHTYLSWWKNQLKNILAQAGLRHTTGPYAADHKHSLHEKLSAQLHSFVQTSGHFTVVALLTIVGLLLIGVAAYMRTGGDWRKILKSRIALKYAAIVSMLLTMACTYFVWWLVLLPASKTFARRVYPVIVPLEIALTLIAFLCVTLYFHPRTVKPAQVVGRSLVVAYLLVLAALLGGVSIQTLRGIRSEPYLSLADYQQTVKVIDAMPSSAQLYGQNWWSSPVISLMSDRDLKNMDTVNVCKLNPTSDFIIWDKIASGITKSPTPTTPSVIYTIYKTTDSATIYRMSPNSAYCSDGKLIKATT